METVSKKHFITITILILILALGLRAYDYTTPTVLDEYAYTWAGLTLISEGTPTSWSWIEAYGPKEKSISNLKREYKESELIMWKDSGYRLVTPWFDHPPLFSTMIGAYTYATGTREIYSVSPSTIRIPMLLLSILTVCLLIFLTKVWFNETIALLTGLFYAIIPLFALSNRFTLAENLITPLFLGSLLLYEQYKKSNKQYLIYCIGTLSGLAALAKVPGLAVAATLITIMFLDDKKNKRNNIITIATLTAIIFSIYFVYGFIFNGELFLKILTDQGSRIFITSIIANMITEPKLLESTFNDGWLLVGAFAFLYALIKKEIKIIVPTVITIATLIFFFTGNTFRSWYLIPVYPFLAIALAYLFNDSIQNKTYLPLLLPFAIIIPSLYDLLTDTINLLAWRSIIIITTITFILALKDKERYSNILKNTTITYLTIAIITSIIVIIKARTILTF
jgi:4-amino-4-deoxy-L-arabinose transferase-like glycosyltransferase